MVGWRGSNWLKLSRMGPRRAAEYCGDEASCRQSFMYSGMEGVVISRISVGYSRVMTKIRVKVMRHSFFDDGGSGFESIPRSPRTHGRLFCRVSHPPISRVALISTMAVHLP